MINRLHILDPNLIDGIGHYLTYAIAVSEEAHKRGIQVVWHTSLNFQKNLKPEFVALSLHFERNIFYEHKSTDDDWPIYNFNKFNSEFFYQLSTLKLVSGKDELFLFPNVLQNQLYSIAEWSKNLPNNSLIVAILRWQNASMGYNAARSVSDKILALYKFTFDQVDCKQNRFVIASDTVKLCDFYQSLSPVRIRRLPNPQVHEVISLNRVYGYSPNRIIVAYLGGFSQYRGSALLPALLESVVSSDPRVSFRIQVTELESVDAQSLVRLHTTYKDKISLFCGVLDTEVYNHLISTASLVLMPYSPSFYHWGSSGVACEALSFGIPAILTANTTMHDEFLEVDAGFVAIETYDVESFTKGCALAISNLDELSRKSREASKRFIARSSPAVFLNSLLSLAAAN